MTRDPFFSSGALPFLFIVLGIVATIIVAPHLSWLLAVPIFYPSATGLVVVIGLLVTFALWSHASHH